MKGKDEHKINSQPSGTSTLAKNTAEITNAVSSSIDIAGSTPGVPMPGPVKMVGALSGIAAETLNNPSPNWEEKALCGAAKAIAQGTAAGTLQGVVGATAFTLTPTPEPISRSLAAMTVVAGATPAINTITAPIGEATETLCHFVMEHLSTEQIKPTPVEISHIEVLDHPVGYAYPNIKIHYVQKPEQQQTYASGNLIPALILATPTLIGEAKKFGQTLQPMLDQALNKLFPLNPAKQVNTKTSIPSPQSEEPSLYLSMAQLNGFINHAMGTKHLSLNEHEWTKVRDELVLTDSDFVDQIEPLISFRNLFKDQGTSITEPGAIYTNLQQGIKFLSQVAATSGNTGLGKIASVSLSLVQGGAALMALAGAKGVTFAAIGVTGPVGATIMAAYAAYSLINTLTSDDNSEEMTRIFYEELQTIKHLIISNQEEVLRQFAETKEIGIHTQRMVMDLHQAVLDCFNFLHNTLTIPSLKHVAEAEKRANAQFNVLDAKIGKIALQSLINVIFQIRAYLNDIVPADRLHEPLFIEYMNTLSGYITDTVRDETYTHSIYLDPNYREEHAKRTYDVLSHANLDATTLSNFIGLIVGRINSISSQSTQLPAEHAFNAIVWYKALEQYVLMKKKFPYFSYDLGLTQQQQIIKQAQDFQHLMSALRAPETLNSLWARLTVTQKSIEDIKTTLLKNANERFMSTQPKLGYRDPINFLENPDDILRAIDNLPIPLNPNFQDTQITWSTNKVVPMLSDKTDQGEYRISGLVSLGNPSINQLFQFMRTKGFTIPSAILFAEQLGLGKFSAYNAYSLASYKYTLYKGKVATQQTGNVLDFGICIVQFNDKFKPGFLGLDMTFSTSTQHIPIFTPSARYLVTRYPDPRVPDAWHTQSIRPSYAHNQPYGNEWAIFQENVMGIVNIPGDRAQNTQKIKEMVWAHILRHRTELAQAVISRLDSSPEIYELYAIKQQIISHATLLGYPHELITELHQTLHTNTELDEYRTYANNKASLSSPLNLKLIPSEKITQLQEKMRAASPSSFGIIDKNLLSGLLSIQLLEADVMQKELVKKLDKKQTAKQQDLLNSGIELSKATVNFLQSIETIAAYPTPLNFPSEIVALQTTQRTIRTRVNALNDADENNLSESSENTSTTASTTQTPIKETHLYTDPLKKLCASARTPYAEIKTHLAQLEQQRLLEQALNSGPVADRPLHLALQTDRVDVVALLLQYGSEVRPESAGWINPNLPMETENKLFALLDFYQTLQRDTSLLSTFEVGRTLGLLHEGLRYISSLQPQNTVNIVIGLTGDGKSTVTNALAGVNYVSVEQDGQKLLQVAPGSIPEFTTTSATSSSETTFPIVVPTEQHIYVDMAGIKDNRGIHFQIANGVGAALLGNKVTAVRYLIVVVDANDLYQARNTGIYTLLEELGKIIKEQTHLIPHIQLIVNKAQPEQLKAGAAGIKRRLDKLLRENPSLPSSTQFILQHIKEEQIMVVDIPTAQFRQNFISRINAINPIAFNQFNFASYHREVEQFKQLIEHLRAYHEQHSANLHSLINFQAQQLHTQIDTQIKQLNSEPFTIPNIELNGSSEEITQYRKIQTILTEQAHLKNNLTLFLNNASIHLTEHYSEQDSLGTILLVGEPLQEINKLAKDVEVAAEFLSQITPVLSQLNSLENPQPRQQATNHPLPQERVYQVQNNAGLGGLPRTHIKHSIPVASSSLLPAIGLFGSSTTTATPISVPEYTPLTPPHNSTSTSLMAQQPDQIASANLHYAVAKMAAEDYQIPVDTALSILKETGFNAEYDTDTQNYQYRLFSPAAFKQAQSEMEQQRNKVAMTNPSIPVVVDGAITLGTFFLAKIYKTFWAPKEEEPSSEKIVDITLLNQHEIKQAKIEFNSKLASYREQYQEISLTDRVEMVAENGENNPLFYSSLRYLIDELAYLIDQLKLGKTKADDLKDFEVLCAEVDTMFADYQAQTSSMRMRR
ncbi:MAG: 50S ribosome-binding GTPase [Legionella sp.]|uniref:hypothetical protein n=1 Tax=Legionella sp. TaxID=459 RepID=UPI002842E068|nr:50S ribosome-binding GTPase [Legionella sp.]